MHDQGQGQREAHVICEALIDREYTVQSEPDRVEIDLKLRVSRSLPRRSGDGEKSHAWPEPQL